MVKYLVLVTQSKKTDYNTKINEIEKKITDHNRVKDNTTQELNKLTSENFAARLKQAHLVNKADFDDKLRNLNKKLLELKRNMYLMKINFKNYRRLTQVKFTLMMMEHNFT